MAKKAFTTAPRPKSLDVDAIERFVEQGHGRDVENTEKRKGSKAETQKTVPMARLTVDMPRELHRRFKTVCAAQDKKMNDEIRNFIERRLAELED
jgi:antitoxin component HigA of HigAB toxin-antitoxin module